MYLTSTSRFQEDNCYFLIFNFLLFIFFATKALRHKVSRIGFTQSTQRGKGAKVLFSLPSLGDWGGREFWREVFFCMRKSQFHFRKPNFTKGIGAGYFKFIILHSIFCILKFHHD